MSCSRCMAPFTVFKKERGCASCRYSFCAKCLNQTSTVGGKAKAAVCAACHQRLSGAAAPQAPVAAAAESAVADSALHDQWPPPSFRNQPPPPPPAARPLRQGTDDDAIKQRLDKLKEGRREAAVPSQEEIEERLAKLRGCDPELIRNPALMFYNKGDAPSTANASAGWQNAGALVRQMRAEVALERPPPTDAVGERLAKLREQFEPAPDRLQAPLDEAGGGSADTSTGTLDSSVEREAQEVEAMLRRAENEANAAMETLRRDDDMQQQLQLLRQQTRREWAKDARLSEELGAGGCGGGGADERSDSDDGAEADGVVRQVMAEAELDERAGVPDDPRPQPRAAAFSPKRAATAAEGDEELPWCCVCTTDAAVRCADCDADLYCRRCFKEAHKPNNPERHKWTPFKKK